MISKYKPFVITSVLLLVIGLMFTLFQSHESTEVHSGTIIPANDKITDVVFESRSDFEIETLRVDIAILREQVALLQKQLQDKNTQNIQTDQNFTPMVDDEIRDKNQQLNEEERREAARYAAEARINSLEYQLSIEEYDITWSTEVESRIIDALNVIESDNVSVLGVECRSTLCKLEVETDEKADSAQFRANLIPKIGDILPQGTMREVDQGGGQKKLVFYMGRNGHELPSGSQ